MSSTGETYWFVTFSFIRDGERLVGDATVTVFAPYFDINSARRVIAGHFEVPTVVLLSFQPISLETHASNFDTTTSPEPPGPPGPARLRLVKPE